MLFAAAPGCRATDVVTGAYATLAEAEQAGAIRNGWMPGMLPKGAHDIVEAHDPDGKRQWGIFNFPPSDADAVRSTLQPEEVSLVGLNPDIPARIEWWPVILREPLNPEQIKVAGLNAYPSRQGPLIVAVNWNQGRAYYWTR